VLPLSKKELQNARCMSSAGKYSLEGRQTMKNRKQQYEYDEHEMQHATRSGTSVVTGFLVGGLIGVAAALLIAPRSGEETRAEIRNKAMEYRDRTKDVVNETVSQAKSKADELKEGVVEKAEELKRRGKQTVNQQLDHVVQAAETGKSKVQEY
jgi:gas vesicle protein